MSFPYYGPYEAAVIARTYQGAERLAVEQALREARLSRPEPGRRLARRLRAALRTGRRRSAGPA